MWFCKYLIIVSCQSQCFSFNSLLTFILYPMHVICCNYMNFMVKQCFYFNLYLYVSVTVLLQVKCWDGGDRGRDGGEGGERGRNLRGQVEGYQGHWRWPNMKISHTFPQFEKWVEGGMGRGGGHGHCEGSSRYLEVVMYSSKKDLIFHVEKINILYGIHLTQRWC